LIGFGGGTDDLDFPKLIAARCSNHLHLVAVEGGGGQRLAKNEKGESGEKVSTKMVCINNNNTMQAVPGSRLGQCWWLL
jgi:hypothetical protein